MTSPDPSLPSTLTADEIERFVRDGHVTVRQAIDPATAERMLADTWSVLARLGIRRDDRSTWPRDPAQPPALARHPTFRRIASPRLMGAIDDLVGHGRWQPPAKRWGFFRLNWPEPGAAAWELNHDGWHWDASPADPHAGLFVLIHIGETLPGGGGTLLVSGSHRLLTERYRQLPQPQQVRKKRMRLELLRDHPWFARLNAVEADAAKRIDELMRHATVDTDGNRLQVVEATGRPGDVTLCHASIYHAVNRNRSTQPRIMRLSAIGFMPGKTRDGTPLARSVEPVGSPRVPIPPLAKEPAATPAPDYDALVAKAVDSPDWRERQAARAELRVAGPEALKAIEKKLDDRRWRARRLVAQLLDNALDETNVHVLLRALRDPNAIVRRNSLHSLVCEDCKPEGCWTVDMTGVLIETVGNDRSPRVRIAAMQYLSGRPPEARSVEAIRRVLATHPHPRVQERARKALDRVERALAKALAKAVA